MDINNYNEKFIEKFNKEFQALLTPANTFYLNTKGETSNAISVNIPQYLTEIAASADATALAQSVVQWEEDNKIVTAQRFATKAYQIPDYNEFFTSPDMKKNAMESLMAYVNTAIGNYAAYQFASTSASTQVKTTGTSTRSTSVVGSTAEVKKITKADMLKVRSLIGKSNMPGQWFGLLDSDQFEDLFDIDGVVLADQSGLNESALLTGRIIKAFGITLFERNPSLGANAVYGTATPDVDELKNVYSVPGATTDSVATTDVAGAIFWNNSALYHLQGMTKTYVSAPTAERRGYYMGNDFTYGVDKIRTDEVGVITLIEDLA